MKVFVGHDPRASNASAVAVGSLLQRSGPHSVTLLQSDRLAANGLLRRPADDRGGHLYDLMSRANQSTEFAISRFLVPMLAHDGWALFVDGDVVFLSDAAAILEHADKSKAVMVVKHQHQPLADSKMDGQEQARYQRKNWSSVCLWNCDHPANRRLSIDDVNHRPGRDLHAFYWLHDSEIGDLPSGWNWLVGERPMPGDLRIAHFTNGGPWLPDWGPHEHDDIWLRAAAEIL